MTSSRIKINPATLRWARTSLNLSPEDLARECGVPVERIDEWESSARAPTFRQLEKVATSLQRDTSFFVLPPPTHEETPIASFRRVFNTPSAQPTFRLLRQIRIAESRREEWLDLADDLGDRPTSLALTLSATASPVRAAELIRAAADVPVERQLAVRDTYALLRCWIDAIEQLGILVFHTTGVPVDEFRGLAIAKPVAPIILINGGDAPAARAFTLLHELCHIALGHHDCSQASIETSIEIGGDRRTETFCNQVAAELLVPAEELRVHVGNQPVASTDEIDAIAKRFAVSAHVAAIRLQQLGLGTAELTAAIAGRTEPTGSRSGGSFYRTQLRNIGRKYSTTVLEAFSVGQISRRTAASLLGATKPKGVEKLRAALIGRSP